MFTERLMRLINLSKKGDAYVVKAQKLFRILGISIGSNFQEFIKKDGDHYWYTAEGKKVKPKNSRILDKWLKDHQRFIR